MKYLLTLLWSLGAIAAQAQQYTGHVADKEDGAPIAGAIVTARDSLGKPLGYTTTSASGDFVLRPRGDGTTAQLDFSTMGYRRQSVPANAGRMLVLLTPETTDIREVTIRAPRLSFRGDTVSYNVSRFTEAQDRSIADVLRKMPGIEVAKSGEIRYNGQPINNFYIEGLDMLDGRYGQATNNIAPQDVASVEVMENHQPIKALKEIVFSDRAAINLRLKPHAKARWTGTLRGGAGWSPALWNGALFAMRIGARGQSMVNLKTDNTGQNPSAETERLSVEDILNGGANDYNPAAHLSVGTSSAPLDDTRTRFNRSHMAGLNNLRKLSEDYQLSSSLTWGYDRLASDRAAFQLPVRRLGKHRIPAGIPLYDTLHPRPGARRAARFQPAADRKPRTVEEMGDPIHGGALLLAAFGRPEQASATGRRIAALENKREMGSYGDRRKPFRPRRICLYDLRRSKLGLLPLCHPPAQYPAGRKLEILTTAARRNARAKQSGASGSELRPASHHRRVPPWSPPPSSATSAAYCSGSDVASAAGNGSRRIIVSVSI